MNTISDLRKALGLATDNQVRNRIEAVKDLLYPHLRRGPNNQILVADTGLTLLRQLQDLHDSGLTMTEASSIMRTSADITDVNRLSVSSSFVTNQTKQDECERMIAALREEIAFLRSRVAYLEERQTVNLHEEQVGSWWERLRGEINGA
ncbi:MAG TPA: hypothetical protein ENH11_08235 [Candidatus Acetothermia bacterium]|nr:hypothetical protein [Candidatus Acetothermia bacterium]